MPVYEYNCAQCRKDFELLVPMGTSVEEVACPDCRENHLTRKVSLFGLASSGESPADFSGGGDFGCGGGGFESGGGCGSCGPTGCGCH